MSFIGGIKVKFLLIAVFFLHDGNTSIVKYFEGTEAQCLEQKKLLKGIDEGADFKSVKYDCMTIDKVESYIEVK